MSDLILYTTEDGRSQIKLRADQQAIWLTQQGMAELFDATKQNISLHLKNIFQDGELDPAAVAKEFLTTAADGNNERQLSFLYTLCRESPSPIRVRNRQAFLDSCADGWVTKNLYTACREMKAVVRCSRRRQLSRNS